MAATPNDQARVEQPAESSRNSRVPSMRELASKSLLEGIRSGIENLRAFTFACGGHVSCSHKAVYIGPFDIRFGTSGSGVTLSVPMHDSTSTQFGHLLSACQPATFGRGEETVLDPEYRKAGKLERTEFATTFCPYEAGIIDEIAQLMLPTNAQNKRKQGIKV